MEKKRFSKKTLSIIESVWLFLNVFITIIIKGTYHLSFEMCLNIGVPILIIGQTLILKFIKVNE